jgi:hypothetical protein
MSDFFFFLAIFFFIFIAWIATGGPTRPISFAGPYITPVTNVGVTQVGYGPQVQGVSGSASAVGGTVSSIQRSIDDLRGQVANGDTVNNPSPYRGQVSIGWGSNVSATNPDQEYISIRLDGNAKSPVDITGWRVQSTVTQYGATIPEGVETMKQVGNAALAPIMLQPGDTAILTTGVSPIGVSFKENECTGYLASQSSAFYPSISQQCPVAADEYAKFYAGNQYRDGGCYQAMQNVNQCQIPNDPPGLSSACYAFMDARLNYSGCVATHLGDDNFSEHTWHVYFGRTEITRSDTSAATYGELWRSTRDQITLYDANGKTVDVYSY